MADPGYLKFFAENCMKIIEIGPGVCVPGTLYWICQCNRNSTMRSHFRANCCLRFTTHTENVSITNFGISDTVIILQTRLLSVYLHILIILRNYYQSAQSIIIFPLRFLNFGEI